MSNWDFINQHRCREASVSLRIPPKYLTTEADGFNGMFRIPWQDKTLRIVASDGLGWQHVSVSREFDNRCPTWEAMCFIKDLFWSDEDWVVQYHPAKSEYVNCHPGCLHLWKPTSGVMPVPDSILVGPKKKFDTGMVVA